jgi:hypothetical protein
MNKAIGIILVSTLLLVSFAHSGEKPAETISTKTSQLNQHALSLLQIDLNSLRWLLGASTDSYLLYSSLEQDGQLPSIHLLEEKGYATLQIVDQLPDGPKDKFLRILPTPKGFQVINTIIERRNKHVEPIGAEKVVRLGY